MSSEADVPDEYADYVVHGTKFLAPRRYSLIRPLQHGSYGVVCSARDEQGAGDAVAIRKVENVFKRLTYAKRLLRELKILRHVRHENVIDVRLIFLPGERGSLEDVYIISDLVETDLASILKCPQPLTQDHCELLFYQVLRGLKFVHSADVLHGNLKPRSLLVDSRCDLKITDFGFAWLRQPEGLYSACPMNPYVCTQWYQAPELFCPWTDVGKPIDVWSVGCILAEMLQGRPLFPGRNMQDQIQLIISCLGKPSGDVLRRIPNQKCRKFIESLPSATTRSLREQMDAAPVLVLDVLEKTLHFNPDRRITVAKLLEHPYLAMFHCPEDEPEREPFDIAEFEFERRKVDVAAIREEMYLESLHYNSSLYEKYLAEQGKHGKAYNIERYRLLTADELPYSSEEDDSSD